MIEVVIHNPLVTVYEGDALETLRTFAIADATQKFGIIEKYHAGNGRNYRHRLDARIDGGVQGEVKEFRNRRDVWSIQTESFAEAHFATFPTKLVELCIKAGSPPNGVVLDPFGGCGTTGEVAVKLGRRAILVELNAQYVEMIRKNLGLFAVAL
jgi:DNA modification methylase